MISKLRSVLSTTVLKTLLLVLYFLLPRGDKFVIFAILSAFSLDLLLLCTRLLLPINHAASVRTLKVSRSA